MADGTLLLEITKIALLPAIGFAAGFAAQWFLQARKSRDELVRALANERATALGLLWKITTLPPAITTLATDARVPQSLAQHLDAAVVDWYTARSGAMYLSWKATQVLFQFLDRVRSPDATRMQLEEVVSALRTRLKFDCGIYSVTDARRRLQRPRPTPWPTTHADANTQEKSAAS